MSRIVQLKCDGCGILTDRESPEWLSFLLTRITYNAGGGATDSQELHACSVDCGQKAAAAAFVKAAGNLRSV